MVITKRYVLGMVLYALCARGIDNAGIKRFFEQNAPTALDNHTLFTDLQRVLGSVGPAQRSELVRQFEAFKGRLLDAGYEESLINRLVDRSQMERISQAIGDGLKFEKSRLHTRLRGSSAARSAARQVNIEQLRGELKDLADQVVGIKESIVGLRSRRGHDDESFGDVTGSEALLALHRHEGQLRGQLAELEQEFRQAQEGRTAERSDAYRQAQHEFEKLRQEIAEVTQELGQFDRQEREFVKQRDAQETQFAAERARLMGGKQELEGKKASLLAEMSSVQQELARAMDYFDKKAKRAEDQSQRIEDLIRGFEIDGQRDLKMLEAQLDEERHALQQAVRELEETRARGGRALEPQDEQRVDDLRDQVKAVERELAAKREQFAQVRAEVEGLRVRRAEQEAVRDQFAALQIAAEDLVSDLEQQALQNNPAELRALEGEIAQMQQRLDELKGQQAALQVGELEWDFSEFEARIFAEFEAARGIGQPESEGVSPQQGVAALAPV